MNLNWPKNNNNPDSRVLSAEEKKTIESLANLKALSNTGKINLLLVWAKLKTATQLFVSQDISFNDSEEIINICKKFHGLWYG